MSEDLRRRLRRLPALAGPFPRVDVETLPQDPVEAFLQWFEDAVDAGVPEPHAVTVSTVDDGARPSSRVVVLKDVVDGRFVFATDRRSAKAQHLLGNPAVALSFYWQRLGRQVRVVGEGELLSAEESAEDFLARSPASRAAAFATRPGDPLAGRDELDDAIVAARLRVDEAPDAVLAEWVVVAVRPAVVELWQGDPGRAHVRIRYQRAGSASDIAWERELLWP